MTTKAVAPPTPHSTPANPSGRQYGSFREADHQQGKSQTITMAQEGYRLVKLSESQVLVEFDDGSSKNPSKWAFRRKLYIAIVSLLLVLSGGITSSLPSNSVESTMRDLNIQGDMNKVLPTAMFLIGYMVGPIVFSPLSETIGRRPVLLWTYTVFVLASLGTALAPDWKSLLVFRLICGTAGSAPQTVVGGVYADLFSDARMRGRMMAAYMSATSFGPILGPIISGCVIPENWRWSYRIVTIFYGCVWIALTFISGMIVPSQYLKIGLLTMEADRLRKVSNSNGYVTRQELTSAGFKVEAIQILTRPVTMLVYEPVVLFSSIYLAYAYGLIFFSFQAYPIVFEALAFIAISLTNTSPVGIGASSSGFFSLFYDTFYEKAKSKGKMWTSRAEFQRLPTGCVGGPCLTIGLFWLGWSAQPHVHWIAPVLSGVFFGFGYQIIFISLQTYIADVYRIYAASALAASVITRSIVGAVLPLAADPLYEALGVGWGTSVIGFASLACLPIPFSFLYFGHWMRKKSPFCQRLAERGVGV
ncbi:major facilitator superfamily domain-containing protein [Aspergillus ambiguus]|uniref:MFS transporter n=1 Tax=Aspergillus ambiguus TaxID=176160 RepID=UPI003CCCA13B